MSNDEVGIVESIQVSASEKISNLYLFRNSCSKCKCDTNELMFKNPQLKSIELLNSSKITKMRGLKLSSQSVLILFKSASAVIFITGVPCVLRIKMRPFECHTKEKLLREPKSLTFWYNAYLLGVNISPM